MVEDNNTTIQANQWGGWSYAPHVQITMFANGQRPITPEAQMPDTVSVQGPYRNKIDALQYAHEAGYEYYVLSEYGRKETSVLRIPSEARERAKRQARRDGTGRITYLG